MPGALLHHPLAAVAVTLIDNGEDPIRSTLVQTMLRCWPLLQEAMQASSERSASGICSGSARAAAPDSRAPNVWFDGAHDIRGQDLSHQPPVERPCTYSARGRRRSRTAFMLTSTIIELDEVGIARLRIVKRWQDDWTRIEPQLRTSIVSDHRAPSADTVRCHLRSAWRSAVIPTALLGGLLMRPRLTLMGRTSLGEAHGVPRPPALVLLHGLGSCRAHWEDGDLWSSFRGGQVLGVEILTDA